MNLIRLFRYGKKKDAVFVLISLIFVVCQVWLDLKLPDYMSEITRLVQTEGSAMSDVLKSGLSMVICAVGSMVASVMAGYFVAQVAARLSMNLRAAVYDKVMAFNMEEIGGFSTAGLITRSTNDITQIQTVISIGLQATVKAPIMAVWAIVKISGKNLRWMGVTGGAVAFLMTVIITLFYNRRA